MRKESEIDNETYRHQRKTSCRSIYQTPGSKQKVSKISIIGLPRQLFDSFTFKIAVGGVEV